MGKIVILLGGIVFAFLGVFFFYHYNRSNTSVNLHFTISPTSLSITSYPSVSPQQVSPTPMPFSGSIYQGVYTRGDMEALSRFEQDTGKRVSLISTYQSWKKNLNIDFLNMVRSHGSIPVYGWTSTAGDSFGVNQPLYSLHNITNGGFDPYITRFALDAKAWGHPFFLKFDQEMNDGWAPWDEEYVGKSINGNQPGEYVAMWRHVHDIFTRVGATNITWVWCPSATGTLARLQELYPGDAYVDWMCMDAYNYGGKKWRTFSQMIASTYQNFQHISNKPIMIGEIASSETGGDKASWITDMLTTQLSYNFPNIKAFIWWNIDETNERHHIDWRIESSPASQQAYANSISASIYANNEFATYQDSPIRPLK